MAYHAEKSPSSSHRWGGHNGCTASIQAQRGKANKSNAASRHGTCGHQMTAEVLLGHTDDLQAYLDREMWWDEEGSEYFESDWPHGELEPTDKTKVDQKLIEAVFTHVDFVLQQRDMLGAELYVEERVPVDHITGEEGATGSTDTALIAGRTIWIIDAKYGRIQVDAYEVVQQASEDLISGEFIPEIVEPNTQLAMYASGTIEKFKLLYDFDEVVLVISQPMINHASQWSGTVDELNVTIDRLRAKARECDENPTYNPTVDNCRFCRNAGPTCEAQTKMVLELTLEGFEDVATAKAKPIKDIELGTMYSHVGLITGWVKNCEARVREQLILGMPVPRSDGLEYKLVEGRAGKRTWRDEEEAEHRMKNMRLTTEQMYKRSLVSPAQAEELAKRKRVKKGETPVEPVLGTIQWNRLQELMKQSDGRPVVALSTDPRPAVSTTEGFEDVPTAGDDLNSDLF